MELVIEFNRTLNDFIRNLKRCYPEHSAEVQLADDIQDTRPLQIFMQAIDAECLNHISAKNSMLFNAPCCPIKGCDLSNIWHVSDNSANKETMWKYLQTLALIGTTVVPYNLFLYASLAQKQWTTERELPSMRWDLWISIGLGLFLFWRESCRPVAP